MRNNILGHVSGIIYLFIFLFLFDYDKIMIILVNQGAFNEEYVSIKDTSSASLTVFRILKMPTGSGGKYKIIKQVFKTMLLWKC